MNESLKCPTKNVEIGILFVNKVMLKGMVNIEHYNRISDYLEMMTPKYIKLSNVMVNGNIKKFVLIPINQILYIEEIERIC